MESNKFIHLGTTNLAGKGPGTYLGGVVKLSKNYEKDVLSSARQFLDAARLCLNDGKIEEGKKTLLVPGVICAAFCCELSLKWLLHRTSGKEEEGHLLTDLFDKLDNEDKRAVSSYRSDFMSFIQRNAKAFIEARYHHEELVFAFREQELLDFAGFLVRYIEGLAERTGSEAQSQ